MSCFSCMPCCKPATPKKDKPCIDIDIECDDNTILCCFGIKKSVKKNKHKKSKDSDSTQSSSSST